MAAIADMRLPPPYGRLLARDKEIRFRFDGQPYTGFEGDTIASALAANGVRTLSRSFKYHRPRGIQSLSGADANALVQIGPEPNVRADTRLIESGLVICPQNVCGSLRWDFGRVIEGLSRFLPVGFYYHAFYRPGRAWRFWEPVIRRMAGLGRVERSAAHTTVEHIHCFADVAVVGGGAAGLAAAIEAAAGGADVMLIDDGAALGGALGYARFAPDPAPTRALLEELKTQLAAQATIRVLNRASCSGWFADNWLSVVTAEHFYKVRAGAVVAATGVIEQPAVFRNNDVPGVMLGSAAQRLIQLYGVKPGRRALVLTANAEGYGVALDLLDAGIALAAVVDLHETRDNCPLHDAVCAAGVEVLRGHTVCEALTRGSSHTLAAAVVDRITGEGRTAGQPRSIACDLICTSTGFSPAAQLVCQAGGDMRYDAASGGLAVRLPASANRAAMAGALNGAFDLETALLDGRRAGWQAATVTGHNARPEPSAVPGPPTNTQRGYAWPVFPHPRGRDFVDFDEDLQVADLQDAVAAGFTDFDLVKRYSTVVMGPSQGRFSALNALRIATRASGGELDGARLTTQRPPAQPEPIAHLAGRDRQPLRRTAMHYRHLELGAHMIPAGTWLRPAYYGAVGHNRRCAEQEAQALRNRVGLIDVSTLGKLEVRGPDAAEFLERFYTFRYRKQPLGRLRYVLMTDESGVIADDGIAARFAEDFFYVTATTTGTDVVYRQMLRWNVQWQLDVNIINVTSAYAGINVAGPGAREVLQPLVADVDLSAAAFGFSECRCGHLEGIPARFLRVGFVGELGWEVHVPAHYGEGVWDRLMHAGAAAGIQAVGIEAQRLLRLEKGHLIVGQDTDGLSFPQEAGMGWAIAGDKPFFVGKRAIDAMVRRGCERQLVGFTLPAAGPLPEECNLTLLGQEIAGRITSVAYSPALDRIIGLAYVTPEMAAEGSEFDIKLSGGAGRARARVVALPFYDPDNQRQAL